MPRRPEQLAHELRDTVGKLLAEHVALPANTLVTVTSVKVATNRRTATVYLSVLPRQRGDDFLRLLAERQYRLQGELYRSLARHPAPRLVFRLEEPYARP